jgi:uncharacterized damage-inducible protein DinB
MNDDIRYPTGKWIRQPSVDAAACAAMIQEIASVPGALTAAVKGLNDTQLDTPYRPGGWTPRQIVHHIADSHMNAYIRFKLGMTEDNPTIKPYDEKKWAETPDGGKAPVDVSLGIVDGVHRRWVMFLKTLDAAAFTRTIQHPERGPMTLSDLLQLYAWHGRHHTAHITGLRQRMGW